MQDRARLLHEEIDTLINGATNRNMRALTAWASGLCIAVVAGAVWMRRRMNLLP